MNWIVPATVLRVIDGDTILVTADLGWNVQLKTAVRIDGINAPETSTPEGRAAKLYAQGLLKLGDEVTIVSKKLLGSTEKYGRTLADLNFGTINTSFAAVMLQNNHAKPWNGTGAPP